MIHRRYPGEYPAKPLRESWFGWSAISVAAAANLVLLVRHAEKAEVAGNDMLAKDPVLSPAGRKRAESLALLLKDANLTAVFSTDYWTGRTPRIPHSFVCDIDHAGFFDMNSSEHRADRSDLVPAMCAAQVIVPCYDLQPTLNFFVERLGFRLDVIFPADRPSTAIVSGNGVTLRLVANSDAPLPNLRLMVDVSALPKDAPRELRAPNGMKIELADANPSIEVPEGKQEFVITRLGGSDVWGTGRAGMEYRDLIPNRLGGRFVASHIRIAKGGPVPDYVHSHRVRFQMIFCKAGWVKVVYEDQGPPFVMHSGDCVLQPPQIRHQVLEASPGLEVIEIGCPAMHETIADYDLLLPNNAFNPDRLFSGQRFVRHVARDAKWSQCRTVGYEARDTGIASATDGLAGVRVVSSSGEHAGAVRHYGELLFLFVLSGGLELRNDDLGRQGLGKDDSCVIPAGIEFELTGHPGSEMLEVALPADQSQL